MTLKNAALFALIGMALLALSFIRDLSALAAGAIAMMAFLMSLIQLLASLSVTVFFYVLQGSVRGNHRQPTTDFQVEFDDQHAVMQGAADKPLKGGAVSVVEAMK